MLNPPRQPSSWQASVLPGNMMVICVMVVLALVSGCATGKFGDGIDAETTAPGRLPKGPVALIMSDAATETVQQLGTYNRHYKTGLTASFYMDPIRQAYVDTSDPGFSVAEVTRMLEARIGQVQRFHSFEEASRSGIKLVAKLDLHARLINDRSSDPASYVSLEFYTADHHYLGTVKGMSRRILTPVWTGYKREKEIVSDIRQQGDIQAQALELLKQQLANVPVEG